MVSHNLPLYIFAVMLFFVFIIASIGFITVMFGSLQQWTYNNLPILTVDAKVVSKRIKTFQDTQGFGEMIPSYNYATFYYVTFELEDGSKLEFSITSVEYENMMEGDFGRLSYQESKYLTFEKSKLEEAKE